MEKEILKKIGDVYDEFGIDVHSVPRSLQSQINSMAKKIIYLRSKNGTRTKRSG